MDRWRQWLFRVRTLFRRRDFEAEMAEEMRTHLELEAEHNRARGLDADEARQAAQRRFGGLEQAKELCRDERHLFLDQLAQDLRYAGRQFRRNPGFAVTAVAILALGIGATTAIFSVVHGMVLKPLPYEQSGQLVQLFESPQPGRQNAVSPGVFIDWREQATQFEELAAYGGITLNFGGEGAPERINGMTFTANGLRLLRAQPLLGRIFAPGEDEPGRPKVIVLTHQLWQRRFGGETSVIGHTLPLNDEPHTIIGVLPAGFLPFESQEFVVPYVFQPAWKQQRDNHRLRVLGRLKPGATLAQARAEIETITRNGKPLAPAWKREWTSTIVPMREQLVQDIKPALLTLLGAVGLVLLIACANVANLLLVKAAGRRREIALRAALGASRGRIVRQLLVESILLALAGAALGLLLATWSVDFLRRLLGGMNVARAHEISFDGGMLGLTLVLAVATGVLFGLAPAWQASRLQLGDALKDAGRGSAGGGRIRSGLIVAEVALALMLLVGAGLLVQSFSRLINVPPGFDPQGTLTLQITLTDRRYPDNARRVELYQRIAERMAALPGVEAAGLARSLPIRGGISDRFFRLEGRADHPEPGYDVAYDFCTADYFRALGVPLRRGRFFTAREVSGDARVALINESLARELFPGEDPLGRRMGLGGDWWEIVGIVGDVRMRGLTRPMEPILYRPQAADDAWRTAALIVRTTGSSFGVAEAMRRTLRELDPTLPVSNVQSFEEIVAATVAQQRLTLRLLGGFAAVALLLAAIGLYGVIAHAVLQRTREFGIRLALGARRRDVGALVLGQGLKLVALGLLLGVTGAMGVTRLFTQLLFETKPTDPATFAGTAALLLLVAAIASWLPARRAAGVDPMIALRSE